MGIRNHARGRQAREIAESPTAETVAGEPIVEESRSIAVLPFVNLSSDKEQEYFADGLTEEILNSLVKTPDLLVTARTSSFSYKGSAKPIPVIATELGVAHVLEGSVRRGGKTLRITAQLIRASDGFHLWSETFDRTIDDIIAVQEEIAVQIANALETTMDPEALAQMMSAGTGSVPAYEAYLTGMGINASARESGDSYELLNARDEFEKAIRLDSEFSAARWELAVFWWVQSQSNQIGAGITVLPKETIETNRDAAFENAIRTERDEPTRKRMGAVQAAIELDFRRALKLNAEYLELRPNDQPANFGLIDSYRKLGRTDELTTYVRNRYAKHDLSRGDATNMLQALRTIKDTQLLRSIANEAIERYGDDINVIYQVHRGLLWASDIDAAGQLVPRILSSDLNEENRLIVELR